MRVFLLLFSLLTGCLSPRPPVIIETPGGIVHARSLETAFRAAVLLAKYDPVVRDFLGTANPRTPILQVGLFESLETEGVLEGRTVWPVYIRVQESVPAEVLVHELVHWHAVKEWDTLPTGVEEGMAHALGFLLTSDTGLMIHPPPEAMQARILTIVRSSWNRHKSDALYDAATWVYGAIGHEELHVLATHAREQALVSIPVGWFDLPAPGLVFLPRRPRVRPGLFTYRVLGSGP